MKGKEREHTSLLNLINTISEHFAKSLRSLSQLFFDENRQSSNGNGTSERVASVGASVLVRLNAQHDPLVRKHGGHRVD